MSQFPNPVIPPPKPEAQTYNTPFVSSGESVRPFSTLRVSAPLFFAPQQPSYSHPPTTHFFPAPLPKPHPAPQFIVAMPAPPPSLFPPASPDKNNVTSTSGGTGSAGSQLGSRNYGSRSFEGQNNSSFGRKRHKRVRLTLKQVGMIISAEKEGRPVPEIPGASPEDIREGRERYARKMIQREEKKRQEKQGKIEARLAKRQRMIDAEFNVNASEDGSAPVIRTKRIGRPPGSRKSAVQEAKPQEPEDEANLSYEERRKRRMAMNRDLLGTIGVSDIVKKAEVRLEKEREKRSMQKKERSTVYTGPVWRSERLERAALEQEEADKLAALIASHETKVGSALRETKPFNFLDELLLPDDHEMNAVERSLFGPLVVSAADKKEIAKWVLESVMTHPRGNFVDDGERNFNFADYGMGLVCSGFKEGVPHTYSIPTDNEDPQTDIKRESVPAVEESAEGTDVKTTEGNEVEQKVVKEEVNEEDDNKEENEEEKEEEDESEKEDVKTSKKPKKMSKKAMEWHVRHEAQEERNQLKEEVGTILCSNYQRKKLFSHAVNTIDILNSDSVFITAAGSVNGFVSLWNCHGYSSMTFIEHLHSRPVSGVKFASFGSALFTSGYDGCVRRIDTSTGKSSPLFSASELFRTGISSYGDSLSSGLTIRSLDTVSLSDNLVLCGTSTGNVITLDERAGLNKMVYNVSVSNLSVNSVQTSTTNAYEFLTACEDGYVALWDIRVLSDNTRTSKALHELFHSPTTLVQSRPPSGIDGCITSINIEDPCVQASFCPQNTELICTSTTSGTFTISKGFNKPPVLDRWKRPIPPQKVSFAFHLSSQVVSQLSKVKAAAPTSVLHTNAPQKFVWDPFRPGVVASPCAGRNLRIFGLWPDGDHSGQFDTLLPQSLSKAPITAAAYHPTIKDVLVCGDYSGEVLVWEKQL